MPYLFKEDSRHGTINAYGYYKCRCDKCKKAHTENQRKSRIKRGKKRLTENDSRHGTLNGYQVYKCRCNPCKEAKRLSRLKYI